MNEHDAMVVRKRMNSFDSDDLSFWQSQSVAIPYFLCFRSMYVCCLLLFSSQMVVEAFFLIGCFLFARIAVFNVRTLKTDDSDTSKQQHSDNHFFSIKFITSLNKGKIEGSRYV